MKTTAVLIRTTCSAKWISHLIIGTNLWQLYKVMNTVAGDRDQLSPGSNFTYIKRDGQPSMCIRQS